MDGTATQLFHRISSLFEAFVIRFIALRLRAEPTLNVARRTSRRLDVAPSSSKESACMLSELKENLQLLMYLIYVWSNGQCITKYKQISFLETLRKELTLFFVETLVNCIAYYSSKS